MKNLIVFLIMVKLMYGFCQNVIDVDQAQITVSNRLRNVFEKYVKDNVDINKKCQLDISIFLKELENGKIWALKMLDASAKIESGILEGNTMNLGSFDECIGIDERIESKNVVGQYCLVDVFLNSNYSFPAKVSRGICLPNTCSITDIGAFLNQFTASVKLSDKVCQTRDTFTFGILPLATSIFFGFILVLVLASTVYDVIYKENGLALLGAFSLFKNCRKIFGVTKNSQEISCIYGLRVLSITSIILVHLYYEIHFFPMTNHIAAKKALAEHNFDVIMVGFKAVDTFFVISGLTLSYNFLSTPKNNFNVFKFYVHRYLRLTPALGAVILTYIGLIQFFNSGPSWLKVFSIEYDACVKNWWKTILYINNFDDNEIRCVSQSWFLSIDMQLYILSPIILLFLLRKPKIGLSVAVLGILAVTVTSFVLTWIYNIDVNSFFARNSSLYLGTYYYKTYTRASPWLIGIIAGYVIQKSNQSKTKILIKPWLVILMWSLSIAVLVCGSLQLESYEDSFVQNLRNSFYNGFFKLLWSVAIAWIIFACHFEYGGFINRFLSLTVFQILSRLSYANYLIHILVLYVHQGRVRSPINFTHTDNFILFCGLYMYTQFASVILALCFEFPVAQIDKLLFTKNQDHLGKEKVLEGPLESVETTLIVDDE